MEGKVTGPDSKPVYGATVSVKNTNVATSTSTDGNYSITLPPNATVLVFSYVGYEVAEETVTGSGNITTVNIVMKAQAANLNEVVVVGYSSQRKKDITGAVTVVNVAGLMSQPSTDAASQLQGRASGVTVVQNGVPGSGAIVRIRGLGSFNNNNPLYVIDGVQSGSISALNPNDIENAGVKRCSFGLNIWGKRF